MHGPGSLSGGTGSPSPTRVIVLNDSRNRFLCLASRRGLGLSLAFFLHDEHRHCEVSSRDPAPISLRKQSRIQAAHQRNPLREQARNACGRNQGGRVAKPNSANGALSPRMGMVNSHMGGCFPRVLRGAGADHLQCLSAVCRKWPTDRSGVVTTPEGMAGCRELSVVSGFHGWCRASHCSCARVPGLLF